MVWREFENFTQSRDVAECSDVNGGFNAHDEKGVMSLI
jgi:hypothetical protein